MTGSGTRPDRGRPGGPDAHSRGAGSLEILIDNLYREIKRQDEVLVQADLRNNGTLILFNVAPKLSPPSRWEAVVEPNAIERMLPNEKKTIRIRLRPPADADVGEYENQDRGPGTVRQ